MKMRVTRIFIKVLSLYGKEGLREEASYNRCKPEEAEEAWVVTNLAELSELQLCQPQGQHRIRLIQELWQVQNLDVQSTSKSGTTKRSENINIG